MAAFERLSAQDDIRLARQKMARWYRAYQPADLLAHLEQAETAPGLEDGFRRLRDAGVRIALVSITWRFAVEALAERWGADFAIGTRLKDDGDIEHFWPADKPGWLVRLMKELGVPVHALAAVGDSAGDLPMLAMAGRGYFVGERVCDLPAHIRHWPNASIDEIARDLLAQ